MQTSKPSVRINPRIDRNFNLDGTKLRHHRVEIPHPKIDHPIFLGIAEILAVLRKRSKDSRPGFLRPGLLAVISWHQIHPKILLIPFGHRCWVLGAEEQASDSGDMLHKVPSRIGSDHNKLLTLQGKCRFSNASVALQLQPFWGAVSRLEQLWLPVSRQELNRYLLIVLISGAPAPRRRISHDRARR